MRLGILPTGYIYPQEQRAVRDQWHHRDSSGSQKVSQGELDDAETSNPLRGKIDVLGLSLAVDVSQKGVW
jgi:hypothetical protein